jgi:DNA-binding beta-propeller fold protein YncE
MLARLAAPLTLALLIAALVASATAVAKPAQRDVLVVSNNWAGTADVVDPHTFKRLARINVIPDKRKRIAEIEKDPDAKAIFDFNRDVPGEGHNQYVDDGFTSKDGRYVYFSRPSFADVVAIDLMRRTIAWRVPVDGYRSDHMALSPDGRRLLVSASTARVVDVIDTRRGKIVARFASGDQPHENNYSRDGKRIYHASIGSVFNDLDDPSQDASKGERVFEVVDARTYKVKRRIVMGPKLAAFGRPGMSSAIRPMAITPDERYVYFQLSFFFGIVQYDLRAYKVVAVLDLPLGAAEGLQRTDMLLDSAHHGLAMNPKGTKLCVAGTMSDYAAIVTRKPFKLQRRVNVGDVPYWSQSSKDGRYCFVSVAGEDRVAVISWKTGRQVARIKTGDHPQRMRVGTVQSKLLR